jgi:hypothetical protein
VIDVRPVASEAADAEAYVRLRYEIHPRDPITDDAPCK